jgi:hypothetical protein
MNGFPKLTALAQLHFLVYNSRADPIEILFTQLYPSKGQVLNHIKKHCLVMNCLVLLGCLTSVS